jgi:D-3-phosphoglycerate dehydrogenase
VSALPRSAYVDCTAHARALLGQSIEREVPGLRVFEGDPTRQELIDLIADAAGVLDGHTTLDAAALELAPRLKTIVFLGTGASSYIDLAAAQRRGIVVRTIRNYGDRTIAEHAFALALAAARRVAVMDRSLRAGRWGPIEGIELAGRTLGVVGLGGVGREMVRIAHRFGMRVIAWSRGGARGDLPCEMLDLDVLLERADIASLHLALTPETQHLFDAARLARLKPHAILVNTARGALVDEQALLRALEAGRIAHAALDVFADEPLRGDHPFCRLENVTLTSHAAYKTPEATERLLRMGLAALRADLEALAAGRTLSE